MVWETTESIASSTHALGHNRLELLLFRLACPQLFGINLLKVREVLRCPALTRLPNSHPLVRGTATIRGLTVPILDLALATGAGALPVDAEGFVIVTEYSGTTQGFLVRVVERTVNLRWEQMRSPPQRAGRESYLVAVTQVDGHAVEMLDVEKVLMEVRPADTVLSSDSVNAALQAQISGQRILVADDSAVARALVARCGATLGVEVVQFADGLQALRHLQALIASGIDVLNHYALLVSDIEMPNMDGYALTAEIRANAAMTRLPILLHTSLSGVFNRAMVRRAGADDFLPKFSANELALRLIDHLRRNPVRREAAAS